MHTITLHSRIKFSRLDSNQRPFVYQTNALNHLSYVRMLEPLLGIEPRTIDYKSIVIPFNYRGLLHACKNSNPDQIFWRDLCYHYTTDVYFTNMSKNQKKTPNFVVQGPSLYIWWYDYILLRTLNLRQSCPLIVNQDWPTFVGRLLTLCVEFCFIVSN